MLADALGGGYRVTESENAIVLTERPANEARAALEFVETARRRVRSMLEELAGEVEMKEALLVFHDAHEYARYVSYFVPDLDETMVSAGMYLHAERPHFLTYGDELWRIEPTIVHELTHAQLAHLPLPLWVNEGMAVNSEQRITRQGEDAFDVKRREGEHRAYWTPETIQDFWNGTAFRRDDDGSRLAYDLGRLLVNGLSADWAGFKRFAAAAHHDDAGRAAAEQQVHVDLGEAVRHFLGRADGEWGARPEAWRHAVEHAPE
jgi:hypothetical protein